MAIRRQSFEYIGRLIGRLKIRFSHSLWMTIYFCLSMLPFIPNDNDSFYEG